MAFSRFSDDIPIEAIQKFAQLFQAQERTISSPDSELSETRVVGRTINALFQDIEFPRDSLKIDWQVLNDAHVIIFVAVLVKHLDLSGSRVVHSNEIAAAMCWAHCPLLSLNLSRCHLRDENTALFGPSLKANVRLQTLDLSNNLLNDASVLAVVDGLKQNVSLTNLNLSRNHLGSASAMGFAGVFECFSAPSPLVMLELSQNQMGGGCMYLARTMQGPGGSGIIYLGLNENGLMPKDAEEIATGISDNNRLRVLGLARNQLGWDGVQAIIGGLHQRWKRQGGHPLEVNIADNAIQDTQALQDSLLVEKNEDPEGYCIFDGKFDLGLDVHLLSLESLKGSLGPFQWADCESTLEMKDVFVWTD